MKVELIVVGKTAQRELVALVDDYVGRICHYLPFQMTMVTEVEKVLQRVEKTDWVVLLDERGIQMSSVELASWLSRRQQQPQKVVFVIGGAYGFSPAAYNRANEMLSLSRMTFSHQMVRLVFVEQLYRACTIIKGEAYHH